ncbi:putative histone chaperone asf1 [Rhypophila decipiens]|uniref:Histone chaperone n=1 Tax=Rhypophila decipiens TaxID=261697 RepID=A0AAN6YFV0_9PEZI|nr:putative histone chaperone asf1 [Rhypophila decipiens]
MSMISMLGVTVPNNPAPFKSDYEFEITFECLQEEGLEQDIDWKLTYVGSAQSNQYDIDLEEVSVGPVPQGINKFVFTSPAPPLEKIPTDEILGVTVILLSGSYKNSEFVRIGYYVNNEYDDEELNNQPPATPILDRIRRNILAEKPRVTRFAIKWDSEASAPAEFPPEQPDADLVADEEEYGAEELAEELEAEKAEAVETDGKMEVEGAEGEIENGVDVEEDEMSEDGSVDIEGESEDDLEEDLEEEGEGEPMDADEMMDVDMDKPAVPGPSGAKPEGMVH